MNKKRLHIICLVETLVTYSPKMRMHLISLHLCKVWLSKKGRLAVQYQQAKERANLLTMGDKHPNQHQN